MQLVMPYVCAILLMTVGALAITCLGDDDQTPRWGPVPDFEAVEDVPFSYNFSGNVSDPDTPLENLTVLSASPYVYTIYDLNVTFLFPNGVLEANVCLSVSDLSTMNATWVHFVIKPVNDSPRWVPTVLPKAEKDVFYSFNLTAEDVDNPLEELTYSSDTDMFVISSSGEIAFVPRNEHIGLQVFNVTVWDPSGASDTMELTLLVFCVYAPPPIPIPHPIHAYEDQIWVFNVSEYLGPPSPCDPEPDYTFFDHTDKFDIDPTTGVIAWDRPTNEDVGDLYFEVTFTDGSGRSNIVEIKVTILNTNDAPVLGDIPQQVLTQGKPYTFEVPYIDDDLEAAGVKETLSFRTSHRELFLIGQGTGRIEFIPTNRQVGVWAVNITVTDLAGEVGSKQVLFVVLNVNDPPELVPIGVFHPIEDTLFDYIIEAHDIDMEGRLLDLRMPVEPDEALTFSSSHPRVLIGSASGRISFLPTNDDAHAGPFQVIITVTDAYGAVDSIEVFIDVINVLDPPHIKVMGLVEGQKVTKDNKYHLSALAKDEDGNDISKEVSWYIDDKFIGTSDEVSFIASGKGLMEIKAQVSDEQGMMGKTTFNVTVRYVDPPEGSEPPYLLGIYGFAIVFATLLVLGIIHVMVDRRAKGDR